MMKKNNVANHERHELHHNELTTKTKKSMLVRIISAVVLICLVVPAIILGDWIYFILMSLALCFACYEILGCAGKRTVFIYIVYVIFVSLIAFWPMFREIVKNGDRAILFSTHITSDLDKCATNITYIHDGTIVYTGTKKDFVKKYLFVKDKTMNKEVLDKYIAYKELDDRIEGLINANEKDYFVSKGLNPEEPDLEQIMVYLERSNNNESFAL